MKKKQMKSFSYVALIVACIAVLALVIPVYAEFTYPGDGERKGSMGIDGKSWRVGWINSLCGEGPTSNDFSTCLYYEDPTATHKIGIPNATGTMALTEDVATSMALTDAKVLIGNTGGLAVEQTISLIGNVTGTLINAGTIDTTLVVNTVGTNNIINNTVSSADILNGTILGEDMAANEIGAREALTNVVTLIINALAVTNSVAVEAGSFLIDTQPISGITNDTVITRSTYTGTNWHVDINGAGEGATDVIVNGVFFRP